MTEKRTGAIPFPKILCGVCFALCFFAFMLTEAVINERCAVIFGSGAVNALYAFGLVCTGLGFLSFSLLRRICRGEKARKAALIAIGALCLAAAAALLLVDRPAPFLMSAAAALLLTGHIGGCVYYNMAMYFAGSRFTGRSIGVGMAAAILLQFAVQKLAAQSVVFLLSLLLSVAFVMYFIIRAPEDWILENPLPYSSDGRKGRKAALALIAAVVLMSLVSGMIDSVLTAMHAEQAYDVYGAVRLFYALGLVLAGVIADFRERSWLPIATVCAILLSSICMFFLSEEAGYFAGAALMYLYSGFYVIFFTVTFLDGAPKSRCPELWAGMGRVVRSFSVAAAVLPSIAVYDVWGSTALAAGSCVASIGVLLVLLPQLGRAVSAPQEDEHSAAPGKQELSPQERLERYARRCSLTPRETEVLEKLLTTDDDLQGIAESLYISRRMVQRYVTSIYEKTGTKSRLSLFQSCMNEKEE